MVSCSFSSRQNTVFTSPCFYFLPCSPLLTWFSLSPLCPRCWPFSGLVLQPSGPIPVFSRCSSSMHSLPWNQECWWPWPWTALWPSVTHYAMQPFSPRWLLPRLEAWWHHYSESMDLKLMFRYIILRRQYVHSYI